MALMQIEFKKRFVFMRLKKFFDYCLKEKKSNYKNFNKK